MNATYSVRARNKERTSHSHTKCHVNYINFNKMLTVTAVSKLHIIATDFRNDFRASQFHTAKLPYTTRSRIQCKYSRAIKSSTVCWFCL